MINEEIAILQWLSKPAPMTGHACGCMGARDGDPVCHCKMAYVETVEGRFYWIDEHRSSDGITHSAHEIFVPKQDWEIKEELEKLPLKERLKRKWKDKV